MTSRAGSSTDHGSGQAAQAATVAPTSPLSRDPPAQTRVREDDSSVINPYKRPKTAVNGGSQQRYASSGLDSAFSQPFTALLASGPPARPASSPWSESGHRVHPPLATYMPPSRASSSATEPDNGGPAFTQYWGSTGPEVFRKLTSYCDAQIQAILQANWEQMARLQRETQAKLEGKERVCQRRIEEKTDIWRSREMKLVQIIRSQVKMIDQLRAQLDDGDSVLVVDRRRLKQCVREAVTLGFQQAVDACSSTPALSGGAGANSITTVNEDPTQGGASRELTSAGAAEIEARGLLSSSPKPFVPAKLFDKERFSAPDTPVESSKHTDETGDNEINLPDWVEQSVFPERVASEKRPATPVTMGYDGSTAIVLSPCSSPGVDPLSHSSSTPAQTAPAPGLGVAQTHNSLLEHWVEDITVKPNETWGPILSPTLHKSASRSASTHTPRIAAVQVPVSASAPAPASVSAAAISAVCAFTSTAEIPASTHSFGSGTTNAPAVRSVLDRAAAPMVQPAVPTGSDSSGAAA